MPHLLPPSLDDYFDKETVFRGPAYHHRGNGFFGNLLRRIVPIFKGTVWPYLKNQLIETGGDIVDNLKSGAKFGDATRSSAKRTLSRMKTDIGKKLSGGGLKRRKKRKRSKKCKKAVKRIVKKTRKRRKSARLSQKRPSIQRDYLSAL
jgi:hypothetical protein